MNRAEALLEWNLVNYRLIEVRKEMDRLSGLSEETQVLLRKLLKLAKIIEGTKVETEQPTA